MKIKILHQLFIRHNKIDPSKQSIWFLHGFGDSGLAYQEVFDAPIQEAFNIYVVDLPGFGVSPIQENYLSIKDQASLLTTIIKEETLNQQAVNIVAHSLGALIGTWVSQNLPGKVNYYLSIEGNLTEADSYFSSKPLEYETAEAFSQAFEKEVFELGKSQGRFKRYFSSLKLANPEGMRNWSITSQEHIKTNKCGYEFKALQCKKLYIWGDKDTPQATQDFIQKHQLPNRLYPGIGHWHMSENAEEFYRDIQSLIELK